MGRQKGQKYKLNYHSTHQARLDYLKHQHTQISVKRGGKICASTSFFQTQNLSQEEELVEDTSRTAENSSDAVTEGIDGDFLDRAYLEHISEMDGTINKKRRERDTGDESLKVWVPECDLFLNELIWHEGRGEHATGVCKCAGGEALFECLDCCNRSLECKTCILDAHVHNYLHRIQKWNGRYFENSTLQELGLRVQLNHPPGEACSNPEYSAGNNFVIIDNDFIHTVTLDFCACGKVPQSRPIQLLRTRLFPATVTNPQSAATFRVLEAFELLSYESKVSGFEFYKTLERLTDNTGTSLPKDRYPAFMRMVREWRYLKLLKRSGRGHDPDGVKATKSGECAVECPACPHPEKNLPSDWEKAPEDKRFLYSLFLCLDANFRLKRKYVSTDSADPGLCRGIAYFVEEGEYKAHLANFQGEVEPKSSCSRHDAINLSDSKGGRGHAATGVGTVECSRHGMWRPTSVGDLQVKERYCNMDYLFFHSVRRSKLRIYVVSYDVVCQWSIYLKSRMFALDHEFVLLNDNVHVKFLVPKFHLPAHIESCRPKFSFNFTPGVGRTDGESVERGWAEVNPLAMSTREMGPGSRRDTLDFHFGDYNWRKITGLGISLRRKLIAAATEMIDHTLAHAELESSLPQSMVNQWRDELIAWENDNTKPNPFEVKVTTPTQAAVRRELSEAEAADLAAGRDFALDDEVSPSVLISRGLDLESEQRAVKLEHSKLWDHSQDRQQTKLQLRSNALKRKLAAWMSVQQLYIPGVTAHRRKEDKKALAKGQAELQSHETPLYLPSQIKGAFPFSRPLAEIEWKLRHAQAHESLNALRSNLQIRSHLYKFKDRFVRGQRANTRARNSIDLVQARIDATANDYRAAYSALSSLCVILGCIGWQDKLRPLEEADKRELIDVEEGKSEGRKKLSWIWRTIIVTENEGDKSLQDALRIEWCKSRARMNRFTEETELLKEEMDRVLRYFAWQEADWRARGASSALSVECSMQREGLQASSERQAALRTALSAHFSAMWADIPVLIANKVAGNQK